MEQSALGSPRVQRIVMATERASGDSASARLDTTMSTALSATMMRCATGMESVMRRCGVRVRITLTRARVTVVHALLDGLGLIATAPALATMVEPATAQLECARARR